MKTEKQIKLAEEYAVYAVKNLELDPRDELYARNTVLDVLSAAGDELTAEDTDRIYGALSLRPGAVEDKFARLYKEDAKQATDWLYGYCVKNDYVKKSALDKNPRFDASNGLVVTINKAKPEFRDPKKAAKGNSVETGFAKCVICRENEGFGARNKRNLRTVSISLGSQSWFWQYSPYGYFSEHGIAVNCSHTPMHIDRQTLENLTDFVDKFPHYFIGCNAPLPRIGGSVLAHDHYQGGGEILPLQKAAIKTLVQDGKFPYVKVGILNWPGTAVRIKSDKRNEVIDIADRIREAWETYDKPELGIISRDDDGAHNAISPTVIKTVYGYEMTVILRSNITSAQYPDGVFHAHPEFHPVKKESIGLIEAQGLFILPGRLEEELGEIEKIIEQKCGLPPEYAHFNMVYKEVSELYESGKFANVHKAMQEELGSICYRILQNTAVFKNESDFIEFLRTAGFKA